MTRTSWEPPVQAGGSHDVAVVDHNGPVTEPRAVHTWLTDMDGVLVHEERRRSPARRSSSRRCSEQGEPFLVLTNNSIFTPRDLRVRLLRAAGSTCRRSRSGRPRSPPRSSWTTSARAVRRTSIGEAGLTTALHEVGYVLTDRDPDYVVLGETRTYSFEAITRAIRLINDGARFIATNPDPSGPSAAGHAAGDRVGRGADQHRPRASSRTSSASPTR